jgi:hypothetical protein
MWTSNAWQGKPAPAKDLKFEQSKDLKFGIRSRYVGSDLIHDINKGARIL